MEILASYYYYNLYKCEDDFYILGTVQEVNSLWGASVNRCGTIKDIFRHCYNIAKLCKSNIIKYKSEYKKDGHCGWLVMIQEEKRELQMYIDFAKFLKTL